MILNLKLKKSILECIALTWLALPMIIFVLGWLRPLYAYPLEIAILLALLYPKKGLYFRILNGPSNKEYLHIDWQLAIALCLLALYVVWSGVGGFTYQMRFDHGFRNQVFINLVEKPWPVLNYSFGEPQMLCYFFAFWLPSALVAKIFGSLTVGYVCQLIYAEIGMLCVFSIIMTYVKKRPIIAFLILVGYCGWYLLLFIFKDLNTIDVYCLLENTDVLTFVTASPVSIMLFWIYNSGYAAWVGLSLIYCRRNNPEELLLIFSFFLFYSPFPAIGIVLPLAYLLLKNFKRSISLYNIVGFIICLLIMAFMMSNSSSKFVIVSQSKMFYRNLPEAFAYFSSSIVWWAVIMISVLATGFFVYLPFVWKRVIKDKIFWMLFCQFILFNLVALEKDGDWGWRIGIPLVCYFIFILIQEGSNINWKSTKGFLFALFLIIGSFNNWTYFMNLAGWSEHFKYGVPLRSDHIKNIWDLNEIRDNVHFVTNTDSFFCKYLMKK